MLHNAASQKGQAAAGVHLPPLPSDCRAVEPHAPVPVGAEALSVLKRERRATDRANARVQRCARHYDNTAAALEGNAP
ncbi:MAG: hypothetical protein E5X05_01365 [Mesorhizobium sp.]|nr:MAG: hypothetical protein E5X05_01365 [Mesorhizobium sp.]